MKKIILNTYFLAALIFTIPAVASTNPIFESIHHHSDTKMMTVDAMSAAQGASMLIGQPLPSFIHGHAIHRVTYFGWGSTSDYNQYMYHGFSEHSQPVIFEYNNSLYLTVGDIWRADMHSDPNSWSDANSDTIDLHLQEVDISTGYLTNIGFRQSNWNRPITTFSW